ncbi:MAG: YbaN family protein [Bacteroidetes bacterium]|nr:YbaN family protein [Bacteroidota bacterium]
MLGLGIIGMILPLMPTTVFLLIASFCYAKSSPKLDEWIHTNKYFGKHLKNYKDKKGTTISVKIFSISFLWLSILLSIYTLRTYSYFNYIAILLLLIAVAVTIHLITIKTYKPGHN